MKLILCLSLVGLSLAEENPILSDDFIAETNEMAETWTAGPNFHPETSLEYIHQLMGVHPSYMNPENIPPPKRPILGTEGIPESFDARDEWAHCKTISEISDQAACGSCWAVAAVDAMSDRICVHKNQTVYVSAENLNSCCESCGTGCSGGYPGAAWMYWMNMGIVSGGAFNSQEGCQPFTLEPCPHHDNAKEPCKDLQSTPQCQSFCLNPSFETPYGQDLHKGRTAYALSNDEKQIQLEIMGNGPVEAAFAVFADFPSYKSGVYQRTSPIILGAHAVRIIGWGVDSGTPYWLVVNSWNSDWGDHGLFKILRGENHCGIEEAVYGGIPA